MGVFFFTVAQILSDSVTIRPAYSGKRVSLSETLSIFFQFEAIKSNKEAEESLVVIFSGGGPLVSFPTLQFYGFMVL